MTQPSIDLWHICDSLRHSIENTLQFTYHWQLLHACHDATWKCQRDHIRILGQVVLAACEWSLVSQSKNFESGLSGSATTRITDWVTNSHSLLSSWSLVMTADCTSSTVINMYRARFAIVMVALWNRADHYIFMLWFVMVALCNRADHYIFILFLSSFFFFFFLA